MAFGTVSSVMAYGALQMAKKAISLTADTIKVALYGNSGTPTKGAATATLAKYNGTGSAWVLANQSTGTGYTAGGTAVTPLALSQTTNVVKWTSSGTPTWTISSSLTTYGCFNYDATASTVGVSFHGYGAQTLSGGTLTLTWNASGIITLTA